MNWFGSNWIWIAVALGVLALHFFGHRHGGHGSGHSHRRRSGGAVDDRLQSPEARPLASTEPSERDAMARSHAPGNPAPWRDAVPSTASDRATGRDRPSHRHGC